MICPDCRSYRIEVTRTYQKGYYIRRRRRCKDCGYRFNTVEKYVPDEKEVKT